MTTMTPDPIAADWTDQSTPTFPSAAAAQESPPAPKSEATARVVSEHLGELEVTDITADTVPLLAAAATELAAAAGISLRFSADDPAVALLRMIAKATIASPEATGPHTRRLLEHLRD